MTTAAATAVAGACALTGAWLVVKGLELSVTICSLSCPRAENSSLGGWMFLAGLAALLVGSVWPPRLARSSSPWVRAAVALPAALFAGAVCFMMARAAFGPWFGSCTLFLMTCAAVAVLVPPRRAEWFAGVVVGSICAGVLHTTPWAGLVLGLVALVVATEIGSGREAQTADRAESCG
jgi:hypothetical protein